MILIYIIFMSHIKMGFTSTLKYEPEHSNEIKELNEFVDIGYSFNENKVYWVGKSPFTVINRQNQNDKANFVPFYASNDFTASEHGGTHLGAPYRFHENGWKVAEIPLNNLLVPGILLDMTNETTEDNEFLMQPQHMINWEDKYGPVPNNSVLLINFGWAPRWTNRNSYLGLDDERDTKCNFPGISTEAAEWIVNSGKIVGVGVDTASVDTGGTVDFKVHQILSSANIYNIENINFNIDITLPARGFDLVVMPMKVTEGSGAPCRIIAVPPRSSNKHYKENNINQRKIIKANNKTNVVRSEHIILYILFFILLY